MGCSATSGQQFPFCFLENVPYMLAVHCTSTGENTVDICNTGKAKTMSCVVMFDENVAWYGFDLFLTAVSLMTCRGK